MSTVYISKKIKIIVCHLVAFQMMGSALADGMASGANDAVSKETVDELSASEKKMEWFNDAKLGIFIHWGIYGVRGVCESWSFFNEYLPYDEYMDQLNGFGAENYDPAAWAGLIKESGARYAVITSKHHDGVALWDTKANNMSVPQKTPAGRDVLTPLVEELRNNDLKVGI